MLFLIWLVLCLFIVLLVLLPPAIWTVEVYRRYSGGRVVTCPEDHQQAAVDIDIRHAALTGMHGLPDLRICDCTHWPERAQCAQGCLSEASHAEPYEVAQREQSGKRIYHLPIFLAAFAAWCLGAVWHSQYLFRARWAEAVGLTRAEVRQIVWWYAPHLLTLAVWLLFAYGVAWLLLVCHRKGVLQGVGMALALGAAVLAANGPGIAGLPHELLALEAGYLVLAALIAGAIVGGLYNKPLLPS